MVREWVANLEARGLASTDRKTNQHRVTWLSLDEADNDLPRFLAYLIAALRRVDAGVGKGMLSVLQSPGLGDANTPPPTEAVLISVINSIAAGPHRLILVLDDYHLIETLAIHEALAFLLEHMPPQMHLVIATRDDPHLPLARLRARQQLTELRASDLRFSSSEAALFLNQGMGLDLSAEDIAALERRTEGWIAGLQLAALSMQGRRDAADLVHSFSGSHRYVLDYLIEEVLEQQSHRVQSFLLETSILERLTGPLCDALTGQENGRQTLETLERANLFIVPLDQERRWYRYHRLFADLLRQRLHQSRPEQTARLHHRASTWYEENGFADEAIEHALRAGNIERAARLLEEHADAVWRSGEHYKLWHWLEALPRELVFSRPSLCVLYAWRMYATGQRDAAEQSLQAAERALGTDADLGAAKRASEQGQVHHLEREQLQGRMAVIRALLAFFQGDVPAIVHHARRALELLPEPDSAWRSSATIALGDAYRIEGDIKAAYQARREALELSRAAGNVYMILVGGMKLAVTMRQQGQLTQAREMCEEQLALADECGLSQTGIAGGFWAILAEVLAESGDLAGALERAQRGVALAERGGDMVVLGWSYLCLMRILQSAGDLAGADRLIQKVENNTGTTGMPPWISKTMAAWRARLWLAQGRSEAAAQWMAARKPDVEQEPHFLSEAEQIVMARVLIAQGRLDEAAGLLSALAEAARTSERVSRVIEIRILQSLLLDAKGDTDGALSPLEQALTLAEPGGFLRIFVDEGPPMAHLLYQAGARGIAPAYTRRLLAAFPLAQAEKPEAARPRRASGTALVEPLSERELEVLELVAQGLTNREIAARLFLSVNTVKAHTRNLYAKLDVHSRTQAAARAQDLGLLGDR
ncbi:MAG: LuxR C-terminal-related transcriptional regulator [Anaerolineae bacterium]